MENTTQLPSKSISDMPKKSKSVTKLLGKYQALLKELRKVEHELSQIMKECPEKTKCYLHYGWEFREPYASALPISANVKIINGKFEYENIEEWQVVLAEFYASEANKLLAKRDEILKNYML